MNYQSFQVLHVADKQFMAFFCISFIKCLELLLQGLDLRLNGFSSLAIPPTDARRSEAYTRYYEEVNHEYWPLLLKFHEVIRNNLKLLSQLRLFFL